MKHSTQYLYNCDAKSFSSLPYMDAINYKLDSAKLLIHDLVYTHYSVRDDQRVAHVFEAIKFNEALLKELKDNQ